MAEQAPLLRDHLERSRLTHREGRLLVALSALDERVAELRRHGRRPPQALLAARRSFRDELAAVRTRLRAVPSVAGSASQPRGDA